MYSEADPLEYEYGTVTCHTYSGINGLSVLSVDFTCKYWSQCQ